jgi:hypothetical protein
MQWYFRAGICKKARLMVEFGTLGAGSKVIEKVGLEARLQVLTSGQAPSRLGGKKKKV